MRSLYRGLVTSIALFIGGAALGGCYLAHEVGDAAEPPSDQRLALGVRHTCWIDDGGAIRCWGSDRARESQPPPGRFLAIATSGPDRMCALRSDAAVRCWPGDWGPAGAFARLGRTCGVRFDGSLVCWRFSVEHELGSEFITGEMSRYDGFAIGGDGTIERLTGAWDEAPPTGPFAKLSAGTEHACAIRTDGTIACWGNDDSGQSSPPASRFLQVSVGGIVPAMRWSREREGRSHSCGVRGDGSLACWGANDYGQSRPPDGVFVEARAGSTHSCGRRADGRVVCWGSDADGKSTPPGRRLRRASAGPYGLCGVDRDGRIQCWGADCPDSLVDDLTCALRAAPDGRFTEVSVGGNGVCGRRESGGVICWGGEWEIEREETFVQVSVGWSHACGVLEDGAARCWSHVPRSSGGGCSAGAGNCGDAPLPAGPFVQLAGGNRYTCGVRRDGSLACWGYVEGPIPTAGDFVQISAGVGGGLDMLQTCALRSGGELECWGPGPDHGTPPPGTYTQVAVGYGHGCAIRADGTMACWGNDSSRQASPPGGRFEHVTAGRGYTCGLRPSGTLECWGAIRR